MKRDNPSGSYWTVIVSGIRYYVANERGRRVRIAYKLRGPGAFGFRWLGTVRDEHGDEIWSGRVFKGTGPLAMLHDAQVLRWTFENEGVTT